MMTSTRFAAGCLPLIFSDRRPLPFVLTAEGDGSKGWAGVEKPIVVSATEARQATKEGVVRYILLVSLVLVVVLFAVAYALFH
jgi:hypothetical protein